MGESNTRPSVTISSYSTLKRNERQQKQASQHQENATRSELSTDFFKVNLALGHRQRGCRQQPERGRFLVDLSQIKGPTGSVRGHENVVRRSLEGIRMANSRRSAAGAQGRIKLSSFVATSEATSLSLADSHTSRYSATNSFFLSLNMESCRQEYLERLAEDEQNLCVAYTTTLGVIRRTFEDSRILKSILNLNLIKYEERDIYLNQEYKFQLKIRLGSISVPALFVDGQHVGGLGELELMNENGSLQKLLSKFKMSKAARNICACCGNARFIACPSCNGSRRSTIHHFKFNSIALRCIRCDKNDGLVMCPACCETDNQEGSEEAAVPAPAPARSKTTDGRHGPVSTLDENNNTVLDCAMKRLWNDEESDCATSKC